MVAVRAHALLGPAEHGEVQLIHLLHNLLGEPQRAGAAAAGVGHVMERGSYGLNRTGEGGEVATSCSRRLCRGQELRAIVVELTR